MSTEERHESPRAAQGPASSEPPDPAPAPALPGASARRRAATEVAALLLVLAAWTLLVTVAWPEGGVGGLDPAVLLVGASLANGGVALGVVALAVRGSRDPRTSLGLQRVGAFEAWAFGAAGLALCYAANFAMVILYVTWRFLSGEDLFAVASAKVEAMQPLTAIPAILVVPVAAFVGLYEEVVFRGFLMSRLRTLLGGAGGGGTAAMALAVLLTSLAFAAGHAYQGFLGVAQTFAVGLVLGILGAWRRNIWPCIVAHLGIDAVGLFALKVLAPLLPRLMEDAREAAGV